MSYKFETKYNSPNFTPKSQAKAIFGYDRKIEGFTLHWWGDPKTKPSYEGVRSYLCRKNGNTSAHIVATGTGHRASCIVNFTDVAWHSGNAWGNARTIGIELDPRAREEDKDVFAEVLADLRSVYGDKPLYSHHHFTSTECSGVYKKLLEDLDKRSYQKVSGKQFGQVTNKKKPVPVTPPAPKPVPSTPSPTTKDPATNTPLPDTGKPVTEKDDFKDISETLKAILAILQWIKDKWPVK